MPYLRVLQVLSGVLLSGLVSLSSSAQMIRKDFRSPLGVLIGYETDPYEQAKGWFAGMSARRLVLYQANAPINQDEGFTYIDGRFKTGRPYSEVAGTVVLTPSPETNPFGIRLNLGSSGYKFDEGIVVRDNTYALGATYLISSKAGRAVILGAGIGNYEHSLDMSENQQNRWGLSENPADDGIDDSSTGIESFLVGGLEKAIVTLDYHHGFFSNPEKMLKLETEYKLGNRFSVVGHYRWVQNQDRANEALENYLNSDHGGIEIRIFR